MKRSFLLMAVIFFATTLHAQEGIGVDAGTSPSAPPIASSPESSVLLKAIAEAKSELEALEVEWATENEGLGRDIRDQTAKIFEASGLEMELRSKLEDLGKEFEEKEFSRFELEMNREALKDKSDAVASEIRNQIIDLKDRFTTGVFALESPSFCKELSSKIDQDEWEEEKELLFLLDRFDLVLEATETSTRFMTPVQVVANNRIIDNAEVLRLGLVDSYFIQGSYAGRLVHDEATGEIPEGITEGLTSDESHWVSKFVTAPEAGGVLPVDVSGGAGFASLAAEDTLKEWFEKGGSFMWGLVALACFSLVMIVERSIVLFIRSRGVQKSIDLVMADVQRGNLDQAMLTAKKLDNSVGVVMLAALENRNQSDEVIESAIEDSIMKVTPVYRSRLAMIALCAAVAPLMGLLGTVTGMIGTFQNLVIFGAGDPRNLAGGISEALITTQAGLYIAIPSLLMRGILGSFAESAVGKIESGAMSVMIEILKIREGKTFEEGSSGEGDLSESSSGVGSSQEKIIKR